MGSKFGQEKTDLVLLGKVWLMPGLVGLAVLDSFAYGTPMITTAQPFHSPEFEYIENGKNGVILQDSNNIDAYADSIATLLSDEKARMRLVEGACESLGKYSIERMALLFADGIEGALKLKK